MRKLGSVDILDYVILNREKMIKSLCISVSLFGAGLSGLGVFKMEWVIKLFILLLSVDIIIVATGWYATKTIKPLFPNWWKRVVVTEGYHQDM